MKKLFIIFCLYLPLLANAQDFETLKHFGDSLKFYAKYPEAEVWYKQAIDRVLNFEEKVTNAQWVEVCAAQQFVHVKGNTYTDDKTAAYVNWEYGENGEQIKTKVKQLLDAGATCVLTYHQADQLQVSVIWIADKQLYIRAYDSRNVYKPLKLNGKSLVNFLTHHNDDLAHETIDFDPASAENIKAIEFKFYTADGVWLKKLLNDDIDSVPVQHKYLYQLLPLVQQQETVYFQRLKTE